MYHVILGGSSLVSPAVMASRNVEIASKILRVVPRDWGFCLPRERLYLGLEVAPGLPQRLALLLRGVAYSRSVRETDSFQ